MLAMPATIDLRSGVPPAASCFSIVRRVRLVFADGTVMGPFATPDPAQYYEFAITPTVAEQVTVEAVELTDQLRGGGQ